MNFILLLFILFFVMLLVISQLHFFCACSSLNKFKFCTPDTPLLWKEDGLLVELEDIIIFLSGFRREPPSGFPLKPINSVHSGEPGKGDGVQPHSVLAQPPKLLCLVTEGPQWFWDGLNFFCVCAYIYLWVLRKDCAALSCDQAGPHSSIISFCVQEEKGNYNVLKISLKCKGEPPHD